MKSNKKNVNTNDQIDFFYEDSYENLSDQILDSNYYDPWDTTRGRNIIRAQGKDGKDVTLYFDALDQQYHLFDEQQG